MCVAIITSDVGVAITNYYVNIYSHDDDDDRSNVACLRASASALCTNLFVAAVRTFCTRYPARCTVEYTTPADRILPHPLGQYRKAL